MQMFPNHDRVLNDLAKLVILAYEMCIEINVFNLLNVNEYNAEVSNVS